MPDLTQQGFVSHDPTAYDYTVVGTAAGTTTISTNPCFFAGIAYNNRVASAILTIYDSVGTSTAVIGTIAIGTSTSNDSSSPTMYRVRTKTGLTVVNTANQGVTVLYK